jgi:hypothetical protein
MMSLRPATLALAFTCTVAMLPGCATEENITAPPAENVLNDAAHEWVIASEPVPEDEFSAHQPRMRYPLQLGNRWKYTAHVNIQIVDGEGEGGESPREIIRTTKTEIIGAESLFERCYAIQEHTITEDNNPGDVIMQRVFFRQNRSGLYEADVPVGGRPPELARPATIENQNPFDQQLAARDQGAAWVRAHRELQDRADLVRDLSHGDPVSGRNRGGPTENELTRLDYPLRRGHHWVVIDEAFLMTATVEGREVLDLPIGRTPARRIRLESEIFGPKDEVHMFYGRLGYLGWRLMVVSDVMGDDGELMGTLRFTDEEYLQDVEIDRQAELPCDAGPQPKAGAAVASR